MIKKMLPIILLSGLLVLPFSYCGKSGELSDSEVNEIFNSICVMISSALSQANAGAMAASGHLTADKHATEIITRSVGFQGTGPYSGVSLQGTITVNTDMGQYNGEYSAIFTNVDLSLTSPNSTVILKTGTGDVTFNGVAEAQIHHSENHYFFIFTMDDRDYELSCDYTVDAAGTRLTYEGRVVIGNKEYTIKYP
jgi:hypothetical protein